MTVAPAGHESGQSGHTAHKEVVQPGIVLLSQEHRLSLNGTVSTGKLKKKKSDDE